VRDARTLQYFQKQSLFITTIIPHRVVLEKFGKLVGKEFEFADMRKNKFIGFGRTIKVLVNISSLNWTKTFLANCELFFVRSGVEGSALSPITFSHQQKRARM
jgi:hypothetical protein